MQAIGLPLDSGHWQIWHAAELKLDEAGTIAAAQTTTSHTPASVQQSVPFAVDRPFAFFIRDRASGTILFGGHVIDPTAG
jgi:serpin B